MQPVKRIKTRSLRPIRRRGRFIYPTAVRRLSVSISRLYGDVCIRLSAAGERLRAVCADPTVNAVCMWLALGITLLLILWNVYGWVRYVATAMLCLCYTPLQVLLLLATTATTLLVTGQ